MKNKIWILLLMVCFISLVSAVPPFQESASLNGLELKYPADDILKQNQFYEFEVHVFNTSNGIPIITGISCDFHLYNSTGNHIVVAQDTIPSHTYDYSFKVQGANFSEVGDYSYIIQCNDSTLGGFIEVPFEVTNTGLKENTYRGIIQGIILLLLFGVTFFFLIFSHTTEEPMIKLFFNLVGYISLILTIVTGYLIMKTSTLADELVFTGEMLLFISGIVFIIIMYYILLNITRRSIELMRAKKGFGSEFLQPPTY